MGIRDRPIAPASPWQNGIAERLIGTLRRECLDHVVIFGEATCGVSFPPMRPTTIRRARIWLCRRMRHYGEPSSGLAALSPSPFWPGCITNMSGYNFRKGQPYKCLPRLTLRWVYAGPQTFFRESYSSSARQLFQFGKMRSRSSRIKKSNPNCFRGVTTSLTSLCWTAPTIFALPTATSRIRNQFAAAAQIAGNRDIAQLRLRALKSRFRDF